MSSKRFLALWKDSGEKPTIYHCISRVVDRSFVFKDAEREHFRMFMRMQENFSRCRVLSHRTRRERVWWQGKQLPNIHRQEAKELGGVTTTPWLIWRLGGEITCQ